MTDEAQSRLTDFEIDTLSRGDDKVLARFAMEVKVARSERDSFEMRLTAMARDFGAAAAEHGRAVEMLKAAHAREIDSLEKEHKREVEWERRVCQRQVESMRRALDIHAEQARKSEEDASDCREDIATLRHAARILLSV